jgi:hypothetical protein
MELRLTGLVVRGEGKLIAYNRIYQSVFDLNWVEKELANLRPYSETFNAWLASDYKDESRLLRGQALQDALVWAAGKSLGDKDYQFLAASQELDKRDVQLALAAEREAKQIVTQAQQKAELALEEEKKAKQIVTQAQRKAELALEEERQANQRLAEAQRKTKRQMSIGVAVLVLSLVGAAGAVVMASHAITQRQQALKETQVAKQGTELERAGVAALKQFEFQPGCELKGHEDTVNSASFSPDGRLILTASDDKTARLWRVENLEQLLARGCDWLQNYFLIHPEELKKLPVCQNK